MRRRSQLIISIDKVSTAAKMKGGNQTELYQGNNPKKNLLKAKMIEAHLINWKVFQK
jgi:hypothetical protein